MAIQDLYAASKLGQMSIHSFLAATAATAQISQLPPGVNRALFMLRTTQNCRIRQGTSAQAAAISVTNSVLLLAGSYYGMVVETDDRYLGVLGVGTAGDLEITLVSDTRAWTLV